MSFVDSNTQPFRSPNAYLTIVASVGISADLNPLLITNANALINAVVGISADLNPTTFQTNVAASINAVVGISADLTPLARYVFGIDAVVGINADLQPSSQLILVNPTPIAATLAANSFARTVQGRLYANGNLISFWRKASYSAPTGSLGAAFQIEFAKADKRLLPDNATWKFEVGTFNGATYDYQTVFDSAKLDSRNLSRSWNSGAANDSLSFSTLIDIDDKFALAPRKNLICYDTRKTQASASEAEPLTDSTGALIQTEFRKFNGLSLYQIFKIAFVDGCGFASFQTDIDNYPLTRVDFNIAQTYKDSVAPFIGNYRPIFTVLPGNVLQIKDGTKPMKAGFTPIVLTADDYSGIGLQKQNRPVSDGVIVQYQSSQDYTTTRTRKPPPTIIVTGKPFDKNYSRQTIKETYTDFVDIYFPSQVTDTHLSKRESTTTDTIGFIVGETIETITIDRNGKTLKTLKTEKAKLPTPENPNPILRLTKSETQNYSYQTDNANNRNVIPKTIATTINALVSTDSENKYLGNDFKQEIGEAHRAGNLSETQTTSAFPEPVKTITKVFNQTGNGQIRVVETLIDILRDNFPTVTISETTSGDISINNSFSKARRTVYYRAGVSKTGSGKPLDSISIGEIPLFFGFPLVERILAIEARQLDNGTASVVGYSKDLKRGLIVAIADRDGTDLGNFLVGGFSWEIERGGNGQRVNSALEISELV